MSRLPGPKALKQTVLDNMANHGSLSYLNAHLLSLIVTETMQRDFALLHPHKSIPDTLFYHLANQVTVQYLRRFQMKLTVATCACESSNALTAGSSDAVPRKLDLNGDLWIKELIHAGDQRADNFAYLRSRLNERIRVLAGGPQAKEPGAGSEEEELGSNLVIAADSFDSIDVDDLNSSSSETPADNRPSRAGLV
jgi:hypothetical protein